MVKYPQDETKAEAETTAKGPELHDIDMTQKLLQIAFHSKDDPSSRAIHAAARHQLAGLNARIQEQIDKVRQAEQDKLDEADAKAEKEAKAAKRKAEDEADKRAEAEAKREGRAV